MNVTMQNAALMERGISADNVLCQDQLCLLSLFSSTLSPFGRRGRDIDAFDEFDFKIESPLHFPLSQQSGREQTVKTLEEFGLVIEACPHGPRNRGVR